MSKQITELHNYLTSLRQQGDILNNELILRSGIAEIRVITKDKTHNIALDSGVDNQASIDKFKAILGYENKQVTNYAKKNTKTVQKKSMSKGND